MNDVLKIVTDSLMQTGCNKKSHNELIQNLLSVCKGNTEEKRRCVRKQSLFNKGICRIYSSDSLYDLSLIHI